MIEFGCHWQLDCQCRLTIQHRHSPEHYFGCIALERADKEIPENQFHHRVQVTSWLAANTSAGGENDASNNAKFCDVPTPSDWPNRPDWRWTVDTYEDLAMARSAFRVFGLETATIDYPTMVAHLDAHPEIAAMNRHIDQKALGEE